MTEKLITIVASRHSLVFGAFGLMLKEMERSRKQKASNTCSRHALYWGTYLASAEVNQNNTDSREYAALMACATAVLDSLSLTALHDPLRHWPK